MSLGSVIDLFVDIESCGQPPSFSLTSLTLGGSQLFAHGTVPGTTTMHGNLVLVGRGVLVENSPKTEEWSLDLQLKDRKEQRSGCADPPLGSVGEWHECYVPRQK